MERLQALFPGSRRDLLTTIVAHDSEHGTKAASKYITLGGNRSYWRFFRIAPSVQVGIVNFLNRHNLIVRD